jgi:cytochrome c peroxidase
MVVWLSTVGIKQEPSVDSRQLIEPPVGFPAIPFPDDNRFTEERWRLGKRLFYDPIMSLDSSISCGSCHMPQYAFSDTLALSLGSDKALGTRNASTLTNVAYHPYFTRDGGVPTLEMQVLVPIQEHNEFNFNILLIADRLKNDSTYVRMSLAAYEKKPDHFVITRALGCFERTLISGDSRYDRYEFQGKNDVLSSEELLGKQLFFSDRTSCSTCHSGFNFTNYSFKNNGLYTQYADSGRIRLTLHEIDREKFKVPTLRNISLTAPYMHDGSIESLEKVVEHYNSGGQNNPRKDSRIRKLNLTSIEKKALVAFLKTLTDESFINRSEFHPDT